MTTFDEHRSAAVASARAERDEFTGYAETRRRLEETEAAHLEAIRAHEEALAALDAASFWSTPPDGNAPERKPSASIRPAAYAALVSAEAIARAERERLRSASLSVGDHAARTSTDGVPPERIPEAREAIRQHREALTAALVDAATHAEALAQISSAIGRPVPISDTGAALGAAFFTQLAERADFAIRRAEALEARIGATQGADPEESVRRAAQAELSAFRAPDPTHSAIADAAEQIAQSINRSLRANVKETN